MLFVAAVSFLLSWISLSSGCSEFYMGFTDPSLRLTGRTLDMGSMTNWTISTWRVDDTVDHPYVNWSPKHSSLGLTGNWLGDDRFLGIAFYADSLNEHGVSCSFLTLINTEYEEKSDSKTNVFAPVFCHWVAQSFADVDELKDALDNVAIWGPDALGQHFAVRDINGKSLVIECVGGEKFVYVDKNDGKHTFGIMTNEPTFDYHLMNIRHYEWKRTLVRQSVAIPGNFYPEERYLRIHMVKSGMQELMENTTDFQTAFSLTTQVLNTVNVPMGEQYGTDSGDSSGEGHNDHTQWALIRDHYNKAFYWRDSYNPTWRRIRMEDVIDGEQKILKLPTGPYFIDMADAMEPK